VTKFHDDQFRQSAVLILLLGFMRHAVEMTSDGMIYIPSFIKISTDVQAFLGVIHI
jgi:hypothetical protein